MHLPGCAERERERAVPGPRTSSIGSFAWHLLVPVVYLLVFGSISLQIAARRVARMLLH